MKKLIILLLGFGISEASAQIITKVVDPVEWVNPLMGSIVKTQPV
jgi:hypothetical protein